MGWTGNFIGYCPKTAAERLDLVAQLEMLNWENEIVRDEVIASACVGSTCYYAIRRTKKADNSSRVFATVCLTQYNRRAGEFCVKVMDEVMGPSQDRCPLRILAILTGTGHPYALNWRRRCLSRLKGKHALAKDGTIQ